MTLQIFLTAKQIQKIRTGSTISIYRNKQTILIGRKSKGDRVSKIKAKIKLWKAKLKDAKSKELWDE